MSCDWARHADGCATVAVTDKGRCDEEAHYCPWPRSARPQTKLLSLIPIPLSWPDPPSCPSGRGRFRHLTAGSWDEVLQHPWQCQDCLRQCCGADDLSGDSGGPAFRESDGQAPELVTTTPRGRVAVCARRRPARVPPKPGWRGFCSAVASRVWPSGHCSWRRWPTESGVADGDVAHGHKDPADSIGRELVEREHREPGALGSFARARMRATAGDLRVELPPRFRARESTTLEAEGPACDAGRRGSETGTVATGALLAGCRGRVVCSGT